MRQFIINLFLVYLIPGLFMGVQMGIGAGFAGAPLPELIVAVLLAVLFWPVCVFYI